MTANKLQRVTIFLNSSVVKQAKAQAIIEDLNLSKLVEKALVKFLPEKIVINKYD